MSKDSASDQNLIKIVPVILFTANRLDLVFKLIYGESIIRRSSSSYSSSIYRKHLYTVTGRNGKFVEYGNFPSKQGFSAFDEVFRSLLSGDTEKFPPIEVDQAHQLNNGAHRTVAAFLQQREISALVENKSRRIEANYYYFRKSNRWRSRLSQANLDYILLRFASISPRTKILVVYPSMREKRLLDDLRSQEGYFAERSFHLNPVAKQKLLRILYPSSENYVNRNHQNTSNAYRDRFNHPGRIRIFFFESAKSDFLVTLKTEMRKKYTLSPGAIHTPDSFEEATSLLEILLIKNSRKNLHNFDLTYAAQVSDIWSNVSWLQGQAAFVGSTPLALLGMRPARDLDLITYSSISSDSLMKFDIHNTYWARLGFDVDDLLDNPKNFMLVFGVKYVSIRNLFRFKLYRGERKDAIDLFLIFRNGLRSSICPILTFHHFLKGYLRESKNLIRKLAKKIF